jgi:hypothetical protein
VLDFNCCALSITYEDSVIQKVVRAETLNLRDDYRLQWDFDLHGTMVLFDKPCGMKPAGLDVLLPICPEECRIDL